MTNRTEDKLSNTSSVDGRYGRATEVFRKILSEDGLIRRRVLAMTLWFIYLSEKLELFTLKNDDKNILKQFQKNLNIDSSLQIKHFEGEINHDVKAVEYYIRNMLKKLGLGSLCEWVHFACTSEDVTNVAIGLMFRDAREVIAKELRAIISKLEGMIIEYKGLPMMSRTHGQPATPTTVGKELLDFHCRLERELEKLMKIDIEAKWNGASGNFNAHYFVRPDIDWIKESQSFIQESFALKPQVISTQTNNYHYASEILQAMIRIAQTIIDLDRDIWGYISFDYFKQIPKEGEVGSSTMPHKVNPIDFENSEGNMGAATALMNWLSQKLLKSRYQRDLSDSTSLRTLGTFFGHFLIALKSTLRGLGKIVPNEVKLRSDLDANWALLAEPIQTYLRTKEGEEDPYQLLKDLTRGKTITKDVMKFEIIEKLRNKIPEELIDMLMKGPIHYVGLAEKLVDYQLGLSEYAE